MSVRVARDEATKEIDKLQKDGEISEDEKFNRKEEVQKKVEEMNKTLEALGSFLAGVGKGLIPGL